MYLKKVISGHMASRKLFPVTWKKPSNNHMIKLSAVKEILSVPCPERATRKRISPPSLSEAHCKKRKNFLHSCGLWSYIRRMIPSAVRGIFLLPPTVFFAWDRPGSLPSTKNGFFPAYRMGMRNSSDMVGKIPPWKWDMVGKIPT